MTSELNHQDKILKRFTATADVFAESVRTMRVEESDRLVELATASLALDSESLAIDVVLRGSGTFTRPFASRARRAVGVDLTPAMIEKARAEAARAGITNIELSLWRYSPRYPSDSVMRDARYAAFLPHGGTSACSAERGARVASERALRLSISSRPRPGGRSKNVKIERVRDPSHTNAQTVLQFHSLIQAAGLRLLSEELRLPCTRLSIHFST